MAKTPEGTTKKKIKSVLDKYEGCIYYRMHVPSGYGRPTLDYDGAINGRAFAIEAKAPGEKPSPRQLGTIEDMERGGITVFVVDGDIGCAILHRWLERMSRREL